MSGRIDTGHIKASNYGLGPIFPEYIREYERVNSIGRMACKSPPIPSYWRNAATSSFCPYCGRSANRGEQCAGCGAS